MSYGGTVTPLRSRKIGAGHPPPTAARAAFLPDADCLQPTLRCAPLRLPAAPETWRWADDKALTSADNKIPHLIQADSTNWSGQAGKSMNFCEAYSTLILGRLSQDYGSDWEKIRHYYALWEDYSNPIEKYGVSREDTSKWGRSRFSRCCQRSQGGEASGQSRNPSSGPSRTRHWS